MGPIEVKREMGPDDIASVGGLLAVATEADHHRPLGEHQWLDLVQGGREGFAAFVAHEPGHDHPVGYAQLTRGRGPDGSWALEFVVDPHHRGDDPEIGRCLLGAALDLVAEEGGGHVHLWVPKPGVLHHRAALAVGLRQGRELLQLRRPLPLDERTDLPVRPFEPGRDEEAWLDVNNRAFARHPEQGDWHLETLLDRQRQPWFDPAGFLLHEVDGRLAGFCWTKVHDDHDPPLGEIYVVAVDPDFQGRGLGRHLAVAGLQHLAGAGLTVGMLYVDRDNAPGRRLYEALGFEVDHVDRAYVGDVAARAPSEPAEPAATGGPQSEGSPAPTTFPTK